MHGKQGHAAYPQLAENPIPKLARIIDRLSSTPLDAGTPSIPALEPAGDHHLGAEHRHQRHPGAGAGQLQHPLQRPALTRPSIEAWVREHCESVARRRWARASRYQFAGTGDVFLTEPGPLVGPCARRSRAVTGREPALTTNGGTSDARFI